MRGKDKCELLKSIREQVAKRYGLEYNPTDCQHKGDCAGTCPRCDAELRDLQRQLKEKGIDDIELNEEIEELIANMEMPSTDDKNINILEGDVMPTNLEGIPMPAGFPAPKRKKTAFKECVVAGWNYHDLEEQWDELHEGIELALVRDRHNKHDRYAVAVALASDYDGDADDFDFSFILGYVPRTDNEIIAKMMDMGWEDVFTAELTTVKSFGKYTDRLRMTIYIQSNIEQKEDSDMFAVVLDDNEYSEFTRELFHQGYIYCRWGGFPVWNRQLPRENSLVVFIHEDNGIAQLYMMRVLAKNDNKASYFIDIEELHCIDDCLPFILTNVNGPITVSPKEYSWIETESLINVPEHPLSMDVANKILELFGLNDISDKDFEEV